MPRLMALIVSMLCLHILLPRQNKMAARTKTFFRNTKCLLKNAGHLKMGFLIYILKDFPYFSNLWNILEKNSKM